MKDGDLLPNGVDTDFYRPFPAVEVERSAIFWGRLDFEPNIDAVVWFCREIWPGVRQRIPDARFTIVGYNPTPQVEQAANAPGVTLLPNVDDLRSTVCEHALVVLPMVSGGGIKNKLLEGAAMGRPILCTPRACMDLRSSGTLPLAQASTPADWIDQMAALWADHRASRRVGIAGTHLGVGVLLVEYSCQECADGIRSRGSAPERPVRSAAWERCSPSHEPRLGNTQPTICAASAGRSARRR
jgi:glycosyltransferase involved in cell wall biosynthesis